MQCDLQAPHFKGEVWFHSIFPCCAPCKLEKNHNNFWVWPIIIFFYCISVDPSFLLYFGQTQNMNPNPLPPSLTFTCFMDTFIYWHMENFFKKMTLLMWSSFQIYIHLNTFFWFQNDGLWLWQIYPKCH